MPREIENLRGSLEPSIVCYLWNNKGINVKILVCDARLKETELFYSYFTGEDH